jgi:hypothetical protein
MMDRDEELTLFIDLIEPPVSHFPSLVPSWDVGLFTRKIDTLSGLQGWDDNDRLLRSTVPPKA